eukprot:COSAG03_NODE_2065_length_3160_cov_2.661222_2_plen_599_part_00
MDSRRRLSRRRFGRASFRLVVLGGALGVRPSVRAGVTVGAHAGCQCSTGRLNAGQRRPRGAGPVIPSDGPGPMEAAALVDKGARGDERVGPATAPSSAPDGEPELGLALGLALGQALGHAEVAEISARAAQAEKQVQMLTDKLRVGAKHQLELEQSSHHGAAAPGLASTPKLRARGMTKPRTQKPSPPPLRANYSQPLAAAGHPVTGVENTANADAVRVVVTASSRGTAASAAAHTADAEQKAQTAQQKQPDRRPEQPRPHQPTAVAPLFVEPEAVPPATPRPPDAAAVQTLSPASVRGGLPARDLGLGSRDLVASPADQQQYGLSSPTDTPAAADAAEVERGATRGENIDGTGALISSGSFRATSRNRAATDTTADELGEFSPSLLRFLSSPTLSVDRRDGINAQPSSPIAELCAYLDHREGLMDRRMQEQQHQFRQEREQLLEKLSRLEDRLGKTACLCVPCVSLCLQDRATDDCVLIATCLRADGAMSPMFARQEAITDKQLVDFQARIVAMCALEPPLLSEEEQFAVEDLCGDFVELQAATGSVTQQMLAVHCGSRQWHTYAMVGKLHAIVMLSEKIKDDAALARQLKRKVVVL